MDTTALGRATASALQGGGLRALADRDGIAQLNKPVKPAALRASLSRIAGAVRQAAE